MPTNNDNVTRAAVGVAERLSDANFNANVKPESFRGKTLPGQAGGAGRAGRRGRQAGQAGANKKPPAGSRGQ